MQTWPGEHAQDPFSESAGARQATAWKVTRRSFCREIAGEKVRGFAKAFTATKQGDVRRTWRSQKETYRLGRDQKETCMLIFLILFAPLNRSFKWYGDKIL